MSKKAYWLGEKIGSRRVGSVRIGKVLHKIGDEIDLRKVHPDKVKSWVKSGAVGETRFHAAKPAPDGKVEKLEGVIKEQVAQVKELTSERDQSRQEAERLQSKLDDADEVNEGLTAKISELTESNEGVNKAADALKTQVADFENRENEAVKALDLLRAKVLDLDSEAKAVLALKTEVTADVNKAD